MFLLNSRTKRVLALAKTLPLCFFLFAPYYSIATSYDELAKIEQTCENSSHQCLSVLDDALENSISKSRQWYRLKLLQLDALFTLQHLTKLATEINNLLSYDTLPVNFSVYVYIYHAKLSYANNEVIIAKNYLDKALSLLTQIHGKYPDPIRLIEIANLQTSMKDYQQAKTTLLQLEQKYKDRYHPIFKRELYANLGHVAYFQEHKSLHIEYRKNSLKWAKAVNNKQQIGIAYNNFAWAYHTAGEYKNAEENYTKAVTLALSEKDLINGYFSQLRLIEVVILQGKNEKALNLFNQLPTNPVGESLSIRYKNLYQELKVTLNQ